MKRDVLASVMFLVVAPAFAQVLSAQEARNRSIKNAQTIVNTKIEEAIQRGETKTDVMYVYWDEDTLKCVVEMFSAQGYDIEKTLEQTSGFPAHYVVRIHWSKVKPVPDIGKPKKLEKQ